MFAVYTGKHDVTARIKTVLERAGIRTAVLRSTVPTIQREAWYAKRVSEGVQVIIGHPKLVETGLDLLDFPTLIFYETGYSLHTLRQSSRRSWRIGQYRPVQVFFLCQEGTMQTKCLRLMGKKLLVALTLEGKFAGEGLHDLEEDDDMLAALARELVEKDGRAGQHFKLKFENSATERVRSVDPTRCSARIEMLDAGRWLEVSGIKIEKGLVRAGDYIEVRYASASASKHLLQPVFLSVRRDVSDEDCSTKQLKFIGRWAFVAESRGEGNKT